MTSKLLTLVCVQHIAKIDALEGFLLRTTSRIMIREKMAVLATSMASRKLHLMEERSRVARLVKIRAGRENLPTKTPIPFDSFAPKRPSAPAAQPRATVRKIWKRVGRSSSIPLSISPPSIRSFEVREELSRPIKPLIFKYDRISLLIQKECHFRSSLSASASH